MDNKQGETMTNHELNRIRKYYRVIDNSLFMTTGNLDYSRITDAIQRLADAVHTYDGDNDDIWYLGEFGNCCLSDFIVGAYWHYTEWHGGQWSKGYRVLAFID